MSPSPGHARRPVERFTADGTIRIVVPGERVGTRCPASSWRVPHPDPIEVPGVGTLTPDNMPDSLVPAGSYEVVSCRRSRGPASWR